MAVAIFLGALIGFVTGLATLITVVQYSLVLKRLSITPSNSIASFTAIITQLLAIPAFWISPWLTTQVLPNIQISNFALPYVTALSISYFSTTMYPIFRWIYWLGRMMGGDGE